MKKITAYIIILTANIILLAHAVLPHHHHQLQICIEGSHCHHHHAPEPIDTSHDHEGENSADCLLKQLIIFPSNHAKQACRCTDLTDGHFLVLDWHAIEMQQEQESMAILEATDLEFPSIVISYSHLLASSSSLRAPPAV